MGKETLSTLSACVLWSFWLVCLRSMELSKYVWLKNLMVTMRILYHVSWPFHDTFYDTHYASWDKEGKPAAGERRHGRIFGCTELKGKGREQMRKTVSDLACTEYVAILQVESEISQN